MKTQLPPCDHDECPKTHCIRPTDPTKLCAAGPTPQSDQAATTPDVLKLLSDFTNKHYAMAADECREGASESAVRRRYDESIAAENALIEALRAQSTELLALRADKQRLDWLEKHKSNFECTSSDSDWVVFLPHVRSTGVPTYTRSTLRAAIDSALNSPTQGAK